MNEEIHFDRLEQEKSFHSLLDHQVGNPGGGQPEDDNKVRGFRCI